MIKFRLKFNFNEATEVICFAKYFSPIPVSAVFFNFGEPVTHYHKNFALKLAESAKIFASSKIFVLFFYF